MYIGKQTTWIQGELEQVYDVARTYPDFVSFFLRESRVLSRDDRNLVVEVHTRLLGFRTSWQGRGLTNPPKAIQFTQTMGLFKGLRARWSFVSKEPGRTRVTICTSFRKPFVSPVGERLLGTFVVERTTQKILRELKRKVEQEVRKCTH